jgi:hypothetical protein
MNFSRARLSLRTAAASRIGSRPLLTILCGAAFLYGCAREPQGFASPEEAVKALTDAVRSDSTERLTAILGSEGKPILSSGDDVADRNGRREFLALFDQKHSLADDDADGKTLIVGNSDWPFPIPIVKDGQKWVFDTAEGREEILDRRIGKNELSTIQVCRAIGDAEHDYALLDPNGDGVHEYAQRFASEPGKHNGLYWPTAEGEALSPLGELVAAASQEGYVLGEGGPTPYHGYYYRLLTAQGPHAAGGELDYITKGRMVVGFAVMAYPAEYDNSGVMTFIMGADGVVYQKDLGKETAKLVAAMKAFDPGEGWTKADEPSRTQRP